MDKAEKIVVGFILAIIIFVLVIVNIDPTGHKIHFKEDKIILNGASIKVDDIKSVVLLEDAHIGNKINGINTITYLRGLYQVDGDKKATVYVYNNSKPYIKIMTKYKMFIYNDKESSETVKTYNELKSRYNVKGNSEVNEDKFLHVSKGESITIYICIIPVVFVFVCLGIYSLKRKTPMFFWSGIAVSSEEISDIKGYNRANGIMWISFGLSFLLIPILGETVGIIVGGIFAPFMIVGLILTYKVIYNKYKVK